MFTRPRIIPVLLYDDRDLIKTINFKDRTYLGDPVNAVKSFNRKGIDELSVLDIGATKNHREPDFELLKDIASEAFMPLSCGGGITNIDAKKTKNGYQCVINDGQELTEKKPVELAKEAERMGAGEIIINSIDQDGMMQGYDIELVRSVADAVKIPVTAIGGAGGIQDLKKVLDEGHAHAAAGGSMFVYYGRLKAVLITVPSEQELTHWGVYIE